MLRFVPIYVANRRARNGRGKSGDVRGRAGYRICFSVNGAKASTPPPPPSLWLRGEGWLALLACPLICSSSSPPPFPPHLFLSSYVRVSRLPLFCIVAFFFRVSNHLPLINSIFDYVLINSFRLRTNK